MEMLSRHTLVSSATHQAPTILVTDTLLVAHLADATICVVRANHNEKK